MADSIVANTRSHRVRRIWADELEPRFNQAAFVILQQCQFFQCGVWAIHINPTKWDALHVAFSLLLLRIVEKHSTLRIAYTTTPDKIRVCTVYDCRLWTRRG